MSREVTLIKNDSFVVINLHGAHVTSWKIGGIEQLFMTPGSVFDGESEVYGGIPIIFPRLGFWGEGKPFHGFARTAFGKSCRKTKEEPAVIRSTNCLSF